MRIMSLALALPACTWISADDVAARTDLDHDGSDGGVDCADTDPTIAYGFPENCLDSIDNNCDAQTVCTLELDPIDGATLAGDAVAHLTTVASPGDVDGDGFGDAVLADDADRVQLFRGSHAAIWTGGESLVVPGLPTVLAGADLDGNGLAEVLVGIPTDGDGGAVVVAYGMAGGLAIGATLRGSPGDSAGTSVAIAGDTVLIGAPNASFADGAVYVVDDVLGDPFLAHGATVHGYVQEGERFGLAVAPLGGGFAALADRDGEAVVYQFGQPDVTTAAQYVALTSLGFGDGLVVPVGDLDGDGTPEVAVGLVGGGEVHVLGSLDVVLHLGQGRGLASIASAGIVDGVATLAIGGDDDTGSSVALVPVDGTPRDAIVGGAGSLAIAGGSDLDGDGSMDLIVGKPASGTGFAEAVFGSASGR
jgi:hypothetical protein